MREKFNIGFFFIYFIVFSSLLINSAIGEEGKKNINLDTKVKRFLESHRGQWKDWNIPEVDAKVLYDLIILNNYKKAVDIGTSTGHSAIWMAWALSKTGGKLITIEIHEGRYKKALANFKEAGLTEYIDARLADAHELVRKLEGPFDFVFSDADKEWYKNYFIALAPKLKVGGCFTAHNVSWRSDSGIKAFLNHVRSLPNFETRIDRSSQQGISISYKKW
ncbi:MAG: class I SAM-dependent methyltransferase [Desulfobacterales bacterium]|nr:MAG: class I SAM-dependent methyltransferase [Desulfobacterales bacterium]